MTTRESNEYGIANSHDETFFDAVAASDRLLGP
jgi:hypothetical protein